MTPQLERLKGIAFSAACKSPKKSNPKRFEDIAIFMHELTPAVVVGLFEEIERLATSRSKKERELEQELEVWHHGPFCWTCGDTGDVHDITGEWRGECDCLSAQLINANRERDQLKAENEALRKLKLPHYLKLSDEMRAAGDHADLRAREDQCYSVPVLKAVFFEAAIQRWLDDQEEAIDAALAGEASHG